MRIKKIIAVIMVLMMVFSLAACGKPKDNTEDKITVYFDTDGGSAVESQTVAKGSAIVKPATPKKEGYIFDKWLCDGKEYEFGSPVDKSITLKATWIDPNEGSKPDDGKVDPPKPTDDSVQVSELRWVNNWYWVQELCYGDPEIIISPESARDKITFTSSDTKIATVDGKGIVYGVKPGRVTITMKCGDKSAELPLEIRPTPGSKLSLSTEHLVLDYNAAAPFLPYTQDLKVDFGGAVPDDKTITWSSSNPEVVYVYENGGIEGRALGHAVITATDTYGRVGKCDVYVTGKVIHIFYNGEEVKPGTKFSKNATYQITLVQDEFFDLGLSKEVYVSELCAIDADPCFQYQQYAGEPYGMLHITGAAVSGRSYIIGFVNSVDGIRVDVSITIN